MNSAQSTYLRLLLICAAFAAGQTAAWAVGAYAVGALVGVALGAAAYVLTQDIDRPRGGGGRGEIRYWRGRPVDDDPDKRRWN